MRWLKGVVLRTDNFKVLIELETGRTAWATPHFKLGIREAVLISWDYTNNRISSITTQERWEHTETKRGRVEESMIDDFQNPSDEVLEGDLSDIGESSSGNESDEEEEESMIDVFLNPLGEDVARETIVEMRDDITR